MAQRKVLVIDAGHQAFDELDATDLTSGGAAPYTVGGTDVPITDGGTGASSASGARTNLGLVIGTDVRAQGSGDPTVPAFATPAIVLGTAAAAGAASTVIRSDGTIVAFDATAPTTQAFSDVAAAGAAAVAARRDHLHGIMALPAIDATGAATDITTRNVSTSAHGLTPKLPNDATKYLDGTGAYSIPSSPALGVGLLPTGAIAQTFPRWLPAANIALLSTGRMSLVMIWLPAGITVTTITFASGTTALSVGVNQWFALFNAATRAKLAVTVDDTSTAWAAGAEKPLALSAPFVTTYSGNYYLGIMVKATTVPSLVQPAFNATVGVTVLPIIGGNSTSGLTNPASCPDPAGAIAGGTGFPYAYVS